MEKKLPTEEANLISQKQQSKADRQLRKPTPSNTKTCQQINMATQCKTMSCKRTSMPQMWETTILPKYALNKFQLNNTARGHNKDNNYMLTK